MRRALVLCGALALAALLFLFLRPHPERAAFLPEAQNDFVLGAVGLPGGAPAPESASPVDGVPSRAEVVPAESSAASEAGSAEAESGEPENTAPLPEAAALPAGERSVDARPERESYPVGTGEIALVVTNRTENDLIYTHWFDFRRVEGDAVVPLTPRAGLMANPDDVNAETGAARGRDRHDYAAHRPLRRAAAAGHLPRGAAELLRGYRRAGARLLGDHRGLRYRGKLKSRPGRRPAAF